MITVLMDYDVTHHDAVITRSIDGITQVVEREEVAGSYSGLPEEPARTRLFLVKLFLHPSLCNFFHTIFDSIVASPASFLEITAWTVPNIASPETF